MRNDLQHENMMHMLNVHVRISLFIVFVKNKWFQNCRKQRIGFHGSAVLRKKDDSGKGATHLGRSLIKMAISRGVG